ncbi:protein kinase [bacterium]|nr:protein kinase [bacterium]MBP9809754.1 protein kinase [bacterium]
MADPSSNLNSYDNQFGTLEVGSFIGGTYRVLDFIGQGGMGFVYKVEHLMMAKVLALKILRSEQVSEEVWKRFRIEAQAIARLDHANVVRIYDMSQTEAGLPFYTMDLLVGESLADYLDEYYRLPVSEALPIFRQVCAGLAYAHDRGIIHRDIKPGNIMLLADGSENSLSKVAPVVKIVDFGIAKLSSFDSGFGQGLTRPGEVFGSPLYMSPEQCSGQKLDHRTDMYSVGVTMFQALTGRPPLLGKTAVETTAMHQSVVPPAMADAIVLEEDEAPVVFPPELEEIVARLLEKSPDDRYDSLADVASELLALERGEIRKGQGGTASAGGGRIAPYAVAEAARRKASYSQTQGLTSGQSETDSGADAASRKQAKTLVLALAGVIALIAVVGIATYVVLQQQKHEQEAATHLKVVSFDKGSVHQNLNMLQDLNEDSLGASLRLSPADIKAIETYLSAHSGFYSKPVIEGGKRFSVFDFPTKFALGMLLHKGQNNLLSKKELATGTIKATSNDELHLIPSPAVIAYPELLTGFRPDELVELCFNERRERTDKLFPIIRGFTKLSRLELRGTYLAPSDLAGLDRLTTVRELCLDRSTLTGRELSRCKILPNLTLLGISGVKQITPLLRRMAELNKLEVLEANHTNLTKQDCLYISKLTNLSSLSLKGDSVTDEDIDHFKTLRKLKVLNLSKCNKLTQRTIDTLAQLKTLEEIKVTEELALPANYKQLRRALPNLRNFDYSY